MRALYFVLLFLPQLSVGQNLILPNPKPFFYSTNAREYQVRFEALQLTPFRSLQELNSLSLEQRQIFLTSQLHPTLRYIFGPMTQRGWGGVQRGMSVEILWDRALEKNGKWFVPYQYQATWLLGPEFLRNKPQVPVPYSVHSLKTQSWAQCSQGHHGQAPDFSMLWYYWEPSQYGCDQQKQIHYQLVQVEIMNPTDLQQRSYPEYQRLFRRAAQNQGLYLLTFAFGYVEESQDPNPDKDRDPGAQEYQKFLRFMRERTGQIFKEQPILAKEYGVRSPFQSKIIGHRFFATRGSLQIRVNVLMAGVVDQMDIFSKSFAQEHESFFGWFGHSRVGLGFDSDHLLRKLRYEPNRYSISNQYQLIYWAGCNSYSYYTVPFFDLKKSSEDLNGTRNLDIISNGLPSYFALNAINAQVMAKHLLGFQNRASFQTIVDEIEFEGRKRGFSNVLVNVLGDEDNPKSN